ncbi:MAG: hypothetical protein RH917_05720 [Lacipirellulaceae bacterium]
MAQPPQPAPPGAPPPGDSRLLTWITFGIIAGWGGLLALGSFLGLDNKTPSFDWRRGGVMLFCSGFFLVMWLLAMGARSRKLRNQQQKSEVSNHELSE